jgi:PAS domain S-box-containing protein
VHSLLARQLRKAGLDSAGPVGDFVRLIDAAYAQYDDDRRMLERSLELSSRELLTANSDLRALLEALPDLFVRIDDAGIITDTQGAAEEAYFPGARAVRGVEFVSLVDASCREVVASAIARVRADGERQTAEYRVAAPDGMVRTYEARIMRVFEPHVIAIIRDVTAVRAEERAKEEQTARIIRQQEALHELAAAESADPAGAYGLACRVAARILGAARTSIWYYDENRTAIRCAWLFADGVLTEAPGLVLRRSDYPAYFAAIHRQSTVAADDALSDPCTVEFAESYLRPLGIGAMLDCAVRVGGETLGVLCIQHVGGPRVWSLEERDFSAAVASFVALSRSIEQRRALEMQLQQSQKMEAVGMLAGGVAHDFNNLLTAILGFADLLRRNPRLDAVAQSQVDEVVLAGQRASELTSQLLAFGRKQPRAPRRVALNALVTGASRMLKRVVGEAITFGTHAADEELHVRVDPNQIEQVLMNLVVNARDAMRVQGGALDIRVWRASAPTDGVPESPTEADWAVIEVEDTGVGIAPEHLDRVFEPFFTTKGVGEGTGLGLSTAYGLVQQNGGQIRLSSTRGKGTVARVYLPLDESEVVGDAGAPIMSPDGLLVGGAETILVVEDEAIVRLLSVELLQRLGYRVLVAGRPTEALELLSAQGSAIDLLITDLVMPEMNGAELYKAAAQRVPGLRVMYMSGYAPDGVLRETARKPGTVFLGKPFTLKQLADRVREALGAGAPAATGSVATAVQG